MQALAIDRSFIVQATVIVIVNYDRRTFMVQAPEYHNSFKGH